jgi:hypothetical protein
MDLMKENIDINAEIIGRLKQELREVSRQVSEQSLKRESLEREVFELRSRGDGNDSKISKIIEELTSKKGEIGEVKEGVEFLTGVSDPALSHVEGGNLCLSFEIEGIKFDVTYDRNTKAVTDIRRIAGDFPYDLSKIMQSFNSIPPAQHLRFAIHSLKSTIHSSHFLKKHVADLRKVCIVKQTNETVLLTLRNGLTAEVTTNSSYSQSPASACLVSQTMCTQ